jgi:hypothetical protein
LRRRPNADGKRPGPPFPIRRIEALESLLLASVQMHAQFLDSAFAQESGIALAALGKFDNSFGDGSVGQIVYKPKGLLASFQSATPRSRLVSGSTSKS